MKPPNASFKIRKIEPEAIAIDDTFGTVAFITRQGYGDWISAIPGDPKPRIEFLEKETHLGLIRGLKFNLHCPHLAEELHEPPKAELIDGGVCVSASSRDVCGNFQATHRGILSINPATGRYEWDFDTTVRYVGKTPARLPLDRIEFNNICPNGAWRCFLMPGEKRFDCTLVTDLQDKVWEFPHQHCLHYGEKFDRLRFGNRSLAGFFGEDLNPVVEVRESPLELTWGICDMFFDLHCLARTLGPVAPGTEWVWKYAIKYLDRRESEPFLGISQRIPLAFSDFESAAAPRVDIGMNDFSRPARIDRSEDVSWFRPAPPARRWDPKGGQNGRGALIIRNSTPSENAWRMDLCPQIPPGRTVRVSIALLTQGVGGKGAFLRLRRETFDWRPRPLVSQTGAVETPPITGDSGAWVALDPLEIHSPVQPGDERLWIEVVLDGCGEARFSGMNIECILEDRMISGTRDGTSPRVFSGQVGKKVT